MGIIGEILVKSRCVTLFYICIMYIVRTEKKDQKKSNHFGFCGLIIFAKNLSMQEKQFCIFFQKQIRVKVSEYSSNQSYEIKSPPWTILWFRILEIFSVENIARLSVLMFQTSDNSQLCIDSQYSSQQLTIVSSLKHKNTQHIYIFNREKSPEF